MCGCKSRIWPINPSDRLPKSDGCIETAMDLRVRGTVPITQHCVMSHIDERVNIRLKKKKAWSAIIIFQVADFRSLCD